MKNIKKNYFWNTIGSFTLSITSLVYMVILTNFSKLDIAGVFSFAFSYACMMVVLASFGGRTFQVTDTKNIVKKGSYVLTKYLTVLFTLFLVFIYLMAKDYTIYKTLVVILLCLFKFSEELSDVYYGILQRNDLLYLTGRCQFFKSILNVTTFFLIIFFTSNLLLAITAILCINLFFTFFVERSLASKHDNWEITFDKKDIIYIIKNNFYICVFLFLSSYLVTAPKYAIDNYLSDSEQAVFNIIIMPATLMLLVGGFIMNPIIVNVAEKYNKDDYKYLRTVIIKVLISMLIIGSLIIVVSYFIGIPILNFIYGINLDLYLKSLILILIGSVFYATTTCWCNVLIAMRKIKSQFLISIICAIIAYILSEFLVKKYGLTGGFYCYTIVMIFRFIVYAILLLFVFRKRRKE